MAVAVTVMVWADVIVAGAVYVAVPPPVGVSVPTCGFIVQVTEVSLLPVTVAVNVWDCPAGRLEPGLTETETAAAHALFARTLWHYFDLLPALHRVGVTVVVVSHDDRYLKEMELPARRLRMDEGRFVEQSSVESG